MEQVEMQGISGHSVGTFEFHSRPRCSLTRAQERLTFWGLAVLCFGWAIGFAVLGYWLVLPFAGLEIGLLAWALEMLRKREANFEMLTINGDDVVLEWCSGEESGRRVMNRHWARVDCVCASPGRSCRLSVSSHGHETEVGHYLSDKARQQLAAILRSRIQA